MGPRQTGKSTLIRSLAPDLTINLAHEPTYLEFARNPSALEQRLAAKSFKTVFIDEVQRLPSLLNTLQAIIDEGRPPIRFLLTGSSASKLKRGNANLLPGRIHTYHLGPLTASELHHRMDVKKALETGTLPGIWTEPDFHEKCKTLRSYAATYLKEEIQAEALTRNIEGFSRFLFVVAAWAGKFLDLSKLASLAQIPRQSALRYFEVLEDTLILRRCEAFRKSEVRRLVQSPRFFFFDTGVLNGLLNNFTASSDRIGALFEHLIFNQLVHGALAKDEPIRISSYRTEHGAEVDFIVETKDQVLAVEVKASTNVGGTDLRGLRSFAQYYGKKHRPLLVYLGNIHKKIEGVEVLPWQAFLKDLAL
ncbi:MAG: ATP-binding protein [Candidatus Omnitrophica bacterium]|nr:ATP-binding protein [Candidatus Omnitrophota bacterium]